MIKWIGRFSLSLQRWRDAWMDNLPMSAQSEEQRQNQSVGPRKCWNTHNKWDGFGSEHTRKSRATKTFLELFCTPKSSMENPALTVSGHVSSMNRIFIGEDYAEDDFGQWTKDEVTGEQGKVDDERSCFWTWDDTECAWQSRPFKGRQVKRRKGKGKGEGKGRKGKEGVSWGNDGFQKGGFRLKGR